MNSRLHSILAFMMVLSFAGRSSAISGVEGTFEYAIDVPWRIEPSMTAAGEVEFGPLPIHFAIHDGDLDNFLATDEILVNRPVCHPRVGCFSGPDVRVKTKLGFVCGGFVSANNGDTTVHTLFDFKDLAEVEATVERWMAPGTAPNPFFRHEVCRNWKGEDCSQLQVPGFTSEWHATLWHELRNDLAVPGSDVGLTVQLNILRPGSEATCESAGPDDLLHLTSENRVHLAESSLPRFDARWLYGDLHYHSQGTDNEGESAYSYRGVSRAMGSMGLDFVFATDHASNGTQFMDSDLRHIRIRLVPPVFEFEGIDVKGTLRDMSPERFAFSHALLHDPDGVNAEAAVETTGGRPPQGYLSHGVFPRVFLGGEVDVIPEIRAPLQDVPWGHGQLWKVINLCGGQPADNAVRGLSSNSAKRTLLGIFELIDWLLGEPSLLELQCHLADIFEETPTGTLLRDFQGVEALDFGRLHIIYLPRDGADPSAFIASDTGEFGGAGRRLTEFYAGRPPLLPEIESRGFFFAAHPLSHPSPGGNGPDGTPWSDFLLEKAFRSPAFLGLQFWNENNRLKDPVSQWTECVEFYEPETTRPPGGFCSSEVVPGGEFQGKVICQFPCFGGESSVRQRGYERMDTIKLETIAGIDAADDAHVPFDTPRAGFDSGFFRLTTSGPRTGVWEKIALHEEAESEKAGDSIETTLYHGAFTWDLMNHWGLDVVRTGGIQWLSEVEPRRLFMAGGSDAHGDFNYRQAGYFLGATAVTDTAIGKPRNLVEVTAAAAEHSQTEVIDALAAGRFAVTDGPALRIAVDQNANGIIDPEDAPMGSVVDRDDSPTVPLLVEWSSTAEFGGVRRIELYVGARSTQYDVSPSRDANARSRTYAPIFAGPQSTRATPLKIDGYFADPTEDRLLRIDAGGSLSGVESVLLNLTDFPAACCDGTSCPPCAADRHFVRAFALTDERDVQTCSEGSSDRMSALHRGDCLRRYAYTNPIWIQDTSYLCSAEAAQDQRAPTVECNTPATISPDDSGISFTATAGDGCETTVAVTDYGCFSLSPNGKRVDHGCKLTIENDTITVLGSGGVGSHITWTVLAKDEAGNKASQQCEVLVERPSRQP